MGYRGQAPSGLGLSWESTPQRCHCLLRKVGQKCGAMPYTGNKEGFCNLVSNCWNVKQQMGFVLHPAVALLVKSLTP